MAWPGRWVLRVLALTLEHDGAIFGNTRGKREIYQKNFIQEMREGGAVRMEKKKIFRIEFKVIKYAEHQKSFPEKKVRFLKEIPAVRT